MEEHDQRDYIIFVNKKEFKVTEKNLTGTQILGLIGYTPTEYDLFLVEGQRSQKIGSDQSVEIRNGLRFNAIIRSAPYG
ncbi:MAG: multiubiquitin domain-containing protein [Thermoplasmatales archaeon]